MRYKKTTGDELCVYALSALFRRHTVIHNAIRAWFTLKRKTGTTFNIAYELSKTHLLYLGNNAFGELHRKPAGMIRLDTLTMADIQSNRELYHDHNIPEMYLMIEKSMEDTTLDTTVESATDHSDTLNKQENLQEK